MLRLCDRRALAEIVAECEPQSRGAPVTRLLKPPHEIWQVDVTDYGQVLRATRGMDAVINMTVVRPQLRRGVSCQYACCVQHHPRRGRVRHPSGGSDWPAVGDQHDARWLLGGLRPAV